MHDVNWWLMALSFLLGLLLTLAFTVRRVTREVPIYAALGRGPKVEVRKPDVDVQKPVVKAAPAVAATVTEAAVATVVEDNPFGTGSVRVGKSVAPPRIEYLVKGDEDTMRYFTVESPNYERVEAEVWFQDAASAERAGFLRWDAPGDHAVTDHVGGTVVSGGDVKTTETTKSTSVVGEPDAGPYGSGSARAGAGGIGPAGWTIKGNADSMLYHTPASEAYDATIAEVWFADEASAQAAGFKKYE